MKPKRDQWAESTEALIESLRQRRSAIVAEAKAFQEEAQRRLQAYHDELDAVKAELVALENVLELHQARVGLALPTPEPRLRALPGPSTRTARDGQPPTVDLLKRWAREHDGQVVTHAFGDLLMQIGRARNRDSANACITGALNAIGTGWTRVSRGVVRFHSIDGQALRAIENEDAAREAAG